MVDWTDIHPSFNHQKRNEWEQRGFSHGETKKWVEASFDPSDCNYAEEWREIGFDVEETKQLINVGFQPRDHQKARQWKEQQFTTPQILERISVGMNPKDADYCAWLRDVKGNEEEYQKYLSEVAKGSKFGEEVVKQIKDFGHSYNTSGFDLTPEQESLIEKLVSNKELKEKYKKYGLCFECQQPNTEYGWCQHCCSKYFQKNFSKWTSGNYEIDKFIQQQQLKATNWIQVLKWIPYEKFTDIEDLAEGGFGKVCKARWIGGHDTEVALKSLNNSQNIKANFLQEIANHKLFIEDSVNSIVKCYGISRDPKTKNYVMVMQYVDDISNDLDRKRYLDSLNKNYKDYFTGELHNLWWIAHGLRLIHEQGLVHRDFHPGNLLRTGRFSHVADLGLCRPADEENKNKIYGVLPYIAPEVLRNKGYTSKADIYSWAIVAYKTFTNCHPYHDIAHGELLALRICEGLRPNLEKLKIPHLLKDLIAKCWDADPLKRPTASDVCSKLEGWGNEIHNKENTEFYQQCIEIEYSGEFFELLPSYFIHLTHPRAIYTSRLLDFKNLPEPQNSKEINEQFWSSQEVDIITGVPRDSKEKSESREIDIFSLSISENYLNNWTNLHPSFTPQLIQAWQNYNFTYQQTRDWINIHSPADQFQAIQEPEFYAWLRDIKKVDNEWVHNYGNSKQLKQEYQAYQQTPQILHQTN